MRLLTTFVLALGLLVAIAPAAEARKYCGKVTTKYSSTSIYHHKTYLVKGKLSCKSVRRILQKSIPADYDSPGWFCIQTHTPRPYDVLCHKGKVKIGAITEF